MQRRLRRGSSLQGREGGSGGDRLPLCERDPRRHGRGEEAAPAGESHPARAKFGRGEPPSNHEGGKDAQPSSSRSYWWRVFRVVPLSRVVRAFGALSGAYGYISDVPQHLASLSAWAARQGLISRSRGRRGARPGSRRSNSGSARRFPSHPRARSSRRASRCSPSRADVRLPVLDRVRLIGCSPNTGIREKVGGVGLVPP